MNQMNVSQIIDAHGGTLKVAVLVNVHQMTVERWRKRNAVPRKYHELLGIPRQLSLKTKRAS